MVDRSPIERIAFISSSLKTAPALLSHQIDLCGTLDIIAGFSLKYIPNKILFSTLIAALSAVFMGFWVNVGGFDYARFIFSPAALVISLGAGISFIRILEKSVRTK